MANQEFFDQAAFDAALEEDNEMLTTTQEDARTEKSLGDTEWNLDNGIALTRAFAEGFTYNAYPHVEVAINSAINSAGSDEDYTSIYQRNLKQYKADQEAAKERIGGAMLAAELAGGIATPVPFAKAGLIGKAATSAGLGGVSSALDETTVLDETTAENAMAAGAEGAILAGAATAGLGVIGKGVNYLTKRNIQTDLLNEDGSFKPIFLAPQEDRVTGFMQNIYRDVLGNAPISGRILRKQQEGTLVPANKAVEEAKTEAEKATKAQRLVMEENIAAAKDTQQEALSAIREDIRAVREAGRSESALTQDAINVLTGKGASSPAVVESTKAVRDATDALSFNFRKMAFFEAFPFYGDKAALKTIEQKLASNTRGAVADLDAQWRKNGFKPFFNEIPAGTVLDRKTVLKDMQANLSADEGLLQASRNTSFQSELSKITEGLFYTAPARIKGKRVTLKEDKLIDPTKLGAAYAQLGKKAAMSSDPNVKRAFYAVQDVLVDILEKNVSKKTLRNFQNEKKKWKTLLAVRDATESTGFDSTVRGNWSPDDWLTSVNRLGKTNARYGTGPLVREAEGVVDTIRASERPITNAIRASFANRVKAMEDKLNQAKAENKRLVKLKQRELVEARRRMPWDPMYSERAAEAMSAVEQAQQKLAVVNKTLDDFNRLKISDMPSFQQETAAFNLLRSGFVTFAGTSGAAAAFGASLPAAALTGLATIGGLRGMASPSTQRFIAGQTGAQQAIQRGINSRGGQMVNQILGSNLPIVTAGMLTGEQQ
jgi:hypothetical protein